MMNRSFFKMGALGGGRCLPSLSVEAPVCLVIGLVFRLNLSLALSLALGLTFGMGAAGTASAQTLDPVRVYATYGSGDTGPNGPVSILDLAGAGEQGVFLWATGGTDGASGAGAVCTQAGTGDALCGISFKLSVTGGYQMVGFLPNPAFDQSTLALPFRTMLASPDQLTANAFDLGVPTPANRYLGELRLRASGANGDSEIVVTGAAIGADLAMRDITAEAVVVPEPESALMLGAGVLGLLALASTRRRPSQSELRAR